MRMMTKALLGVAATAALASGAVAADKAAKQAMHVAEIPLGDGQVAQVQYVGDVPPKISITPVEQRVLPIAMFDPGFASFDRMFAEMDARADAMLRQAAMMAQAPVAADGKTTQAAVQQMPAGTVSYSFVSTSSGDGCTRTMQTSYSAGQKQPQVVRQESAGCNAADRAPIPVSVPATAAPAKVTPVAAPAPAKKPFDPKTI